MRESTSGQNVLTLALLSIAQFLIALDYSIVYIALPDIARELRLESAVAQWVISAYAVCFAGFLVVGGRLSDRVGAHRLFIVSIVAFGLASALGGAAENGPILLVARGVQGLSAAMLQPAVLGLIGATFPAGPLRSKALAVWGSVGASGLAAGAILGGLLTSASWRLVFVVNVPLTLLCALGAVCWLRRTRNDETVNRIPAFASLLGTCTAIVLALGLTLASDHGRGYAVPVACVGLALLLFIGFVRNERRSRNVLIEPVVRRIRSLRTGAMATALYMASVGSEFYVLTLLLQTMKEYSPLQAGLAFLPLALMVTAGSTTAGRVVGRLGSAPVLVGGFAIATVGLAWLSLTLHGDSYVVDLLPGILLSGFGHGVIYTSMFIIGTRDVPLAHQGTAGALLTTSQYLSGALTVAVLTLLLGASPDNGTFRVAFLVTTVAAAVGGVLAYVRRR